MRHEKNAAQWRVSQSGHRTALASRTTRRPGSGRGRPARLSQLTVTTSVKSRAGMPAPAGALDASPVAPVSGQGSPAAVAGPRIGPHGKLVTLIMPVPLAFALNRQ